MCNKQKTRQRERKQNQVDNVREPLRQVRGKKITEDKKYMNVEKSFEA